MATKTINAETLAKMFLAGAQNIEAKKEIINELNVFPVPDGDTGTNMSLTILSAVREVTALGKADMKGLAKAISSGSLRGARGNSGVILSQLLRGFTRAIREEKEIDVAILAAAGLQKKRPRWLLRQKIWKNSSRQSSITHRKSSQRLRICFRS